MEWLFQPSYLGVRSSGVYSCKDYTNSHPNEVALYIQTCLKGVTHGKPKKLAAFLVQEIWKKVQLKTSDP